MYLANTDYLIITTTTLIMIIINTCYYITRDQEIFKMRYIIIQRNVLRKQ